MENRQTLDKTATVMMVVVCAIWGLQQVAIKVAAQDVSPMLQIALRSGVAAVMVGLLLTLRRYREKCHWQTWRGGVVVGVLFAVEYIAVSVGLSYTSAAHMVIFLYTAPLFAAIGLHLRFASERLSRLQWLGILIAFIGIAIAFYTPGKPGDGWVTPQRMGDALGVVGAIAWGATTLSIRCSRLTDAPAPLTLFYQLAGACIILGLVALVTGQTRFHLSGIAFASLAFQTVVFSFLSLLVWFWLLSRYLGSRLGVLSFLTPLFGVAFGVWLLSEPLESTFVLGSLLVLVGIVVVSGHDVLHGDKAVARLST
ncbi:DMT family transporter [Pseudomonas sp. BIGb0164]|uniref:DMT family transporter n=1 Tax=Pseudomonas sp. BIGb0164 TaxID=2940605 RepID=UPI00216844C9|nr:DMT family transporter [Pseudomonas sp. BIGb0164]MCS4246304.1 drug/metabolite transporter (DMT)-like permease [Pseudomonas sp. BIGb0164]